MSNKPKRRGRPAGSKIIDGKLVLKKDLKDLPKGSGAPTNVDAPKKRRGRPAGSKIIDGKLVLKKDLKDLKDLPVSIPSTESVDPIKSVDPTTETPIKRGRGRPKGSKNKPKAKAETKAKKSPKASKVSTESDSIEFLPAHKIVYTKDGIELAPFPDVSIYKQAKRQQGLVDEWLFDQARNQGLRLRKRNSISESQLAKINDYLFGEGENYVSAKKKRGRIKVPEENETSTESEKEVKANKANKAKAKKSPKPKPKPEADDTDDTDDVVVPKKRRGRPPKAKPIEEAVDGDVAVSNVTSSKFLGFCPDGCDAILSESNKVSDRKVECYSCGERIWIKDLAEKSSREKPKNEKEYYESSASTDFCSDMRPVSKHVKEFDTTEEAESEAESEAEAGGESGESEESQE